MSADDLAMLKEGNPEKQQQYQALLKKVQWQDFVVRLQTRTRSECCDWLYGLCVYVRYVGPDMCRV